MPVVVSRAADVSRGQAELLEHLRGKLCPSPHPAAIEALVWKRHQGRGCLRAPRWQKKVLSLGHGRLVAAANSRQMLSGNHKKPVCVQDLESVCLAWAAQCATLYPVDATPPRPPTNTQPHKQVQRQDIVVDDLQRRDLPPGMVVSDFSGPEPGKPFYCFILSLLRPQGKSYVYACSTVCPFPCLTRWHCCMLHLLPWVPLVFCCQLLRTTLPWPLHSVPNVTAG